MTISSVLAAIANELAKQAQSEIPKHNNDEIVQREWLENGIYNRLSQIGDETYIYQFDFRYKKKPLLCGRR